MKNVLRLFSILGLLLLAGCQKMETTQYAVRFRKLPTFLFGGVSETVIAPGQTTAVMPWDSIYRFDTSVKDISWGGRIDGQDTKSAHVHTRAMDGNEVALAVTIRYRVSPDARTLVKLVEEVATNDEQVRDVVIAVGRADIRTFMNELETSEFLDEKSRYEAVDKVTTSMRSRLSKYGIEVIRVALDDYRFERVLRDGSVDSSYQDKLTEIQKLREDTGREKSRIATIKAKKLQELNNAEAVVNRQIAEAQGYKKQAVLKGDGYFQAKSNEAQSILTSGKAAVEGIVEQINALAGPGGEAILKLELARELMKNSPQFVLLGNAQGTNNLEVNRIDTNDLMQQLGVFDALSAKSRTANITKQNADLKTSSETGVEK